MKSLITRKKVVSIISIAFSIIILSIAIFTFYRINRPVYTFDEITNNLFSQYDHTNAKNEKSAKYAEKLIEEYKSYKYLEYSGPLGNTTRILYEFYDNNDLLLLKIRFIGNNDIIQVIIDGKTKTYQGK